MHVLNELDT